MIVKQMDVRTNIKKYFDMAYSGEVIVVPRKESKNVVILSEEEYNRLIGKERLAVYADKINNTVQKKNAALSVRSNLKMHNLDKLGKIESFKENWNGNGAPAFSKNLINKVKEIVDNSVIQPEIFPTALGTIQLEYDNSRKDHMEIEISEAGEAELFTVLFNGEEIYKVISSDISTINERVGAFYG